MAMPCCFAECCTKTFRTHRERKETYIHALESEVLALRTRARSVQEQNDELSRQIEALRRANGQSAGSEVRGAEWGTGGDVVGSMGLGVDGEDTGSMTVGGYRGQWLSMSSGMPGRACSEMTWKGGRRDWSISADHADVAMEFVLTYVQISSTVSSSTDISLALRNHASCGRNRLFLTH
jgi:hypothetical protein